MNNDERGAILTTIEDYLGFLEMSVPDARSYKGTGRYKRLPLSVFKHAEPLAIGFGDRPNLDTEDLVGSERHYYGAQRDNNPAHWLPHFDVALLVAGRAKEEDPNQRFALRRIRTLTAQEKRGRIRPWVPYAVQSLAAAVKVDGTYASTYTEWGWMGQKWQDVHAGEVLWFGDTAPDLLPTKKGPSHLTLIGLAHQHAIYRSLLWHVSIGLAGQQASLLLPCEAGTILDLFRFREMPEGKKRRDALLHWVDAHWRSTPTAPDDAVRVASHLRGQTRFTWRDGLAVQIMPAEEDKKLLKPAAKHALTPSAPR